MFQGVLAPVYVGSLSNENKIELLSGLGKGDEKAERGGNNRMSH